MCADVVRVAMAAVATVTVCSGNSSSRDRKAPLVGVIRRESLKMETKGTIACGQVYLHQTRN